MSTKEPILGEAQPAEQWPPAPSQTATAKSLIDELTGLTDVVLEAHSEDGVVQYHTLVSPAGKPTFVRVVQSTNRRTAPADIRPEEATRAERLSRSELCAELVALLETHVALPTKRRTPIGEAGTIEVLDQDVATDLGTPTYQLLHR